MPSVIAVASSAPPPTPGPSLCASPPPIVASLLPSPDAASPLALPDGAPQAQEFQPSPSAMQLWPPRHPPEPMQAWVTPGTHTLPVAVEPPHPGEAATITVAARSEVSKPPPARIRINVLPPCELAMIARKTSYVKLQHPVSRNAEALRTIGQKEVIRRRTSSASLVRKPPFAPAPLPAKAATSLRPTVFVFLGHASAR